ncbi:MAG TPA: signal peptide peptidase SppA [Candidatus Binatia bacterium]|jgi:protease-4
MRSFFAAFFGTLAALAVLAAAATIIVAVLLSGASLKTESVPDVPHDSYLVLDLSDEIQDTPLQNEGIEDIADLFGNNDNNHVLQARQVTRALEAAAHDPDIAGVYISGQEPSVQTTNGFASLKEIRDALIAFRAAGKPVKAWLTYAGTREYYLASAADDIALDPFGALLVPGLATQPMFYAGAFDKLGIGVQVTRVGKYKSAVEPYTRKDMSPESRAQTQKLLDDIWSDLVHSIEDSRKLASGSIQQTADSQGLVRAEQAVTSHLVDRTAYVDEIYDELRLATGVKGNSDPFHQVPIGQYARLIPATNLVARRRLPGDPQPASTAHEKIAIVYTEGPIVDGSGSQQGMVWGDKVARQLRDLRRDETVKALVLRVNSPGGSVSASETIQREVRLIQKSKPVVVSMGAVAASGGYWISTYSDRIFAEPTTITGSIGVFGLLFNVQGLATDKLGLTFETVKTGRFADAATVTRPKTPEELAVLQKSVDWIYDQFLGKVAESRHLDVHDVGEIAQGRVWSGTEATRIGLVDEIGGLDAAVRFAAQKASVGDEFTVVEYPERKGLIDSLTEALTKKQKDKADAGVIGSFVRTAIDGIAALSQFNDPRGVYARLPFDAALR